MTKKISKVIIYYEDGTYEEVKAGLPDTQGQQDKKVVSPNPVVPDFRPDIQKIKEWPTDSTSNVCSTARYLAISYMASKHCVVCSRG